MWNKKKIFYLLFIIMILWTINNTKNKVTAYEAAATEWGIKTELTPEYPAPGDYVNIHLSSYSVRLESSNISYFINGKYYSGGTGKKDLNFRIPFFNKTIKVNIVAKEFGGKVMKKEIKIKPASVDLIYEVVDPYRIPFYKGKSVALSNSKVNIFALPNFINDNDEILDPKSLIYRWKINDKVQVSKSGVGKNFLYIDKIYGTPRKTIVEVEVTSLDGKIKAIRSLIFNPGYASVDFYIDDKILPFNFKSVAKANLIGKTLNTDIIAVPYFINDLNHADIQWNINNVNINLLAGSDPLKMNIIKNQDNVGIDLRINLKIENENRVFQAIDDKIIFSASRSLKDKYDQLRSVNQKRKEAGIENNSFFGL